MDLTWSDEQQMLREVVRAAAARHSTPAIVRALEDDPAGFRRELWEELARMDVLGLTVPERYGGVGQTLLEQAVVHEELGRALAPTPSLVSAVLASAFIRIAGSEEQRAEWLPRIARGEAIVSCAWLEPGRGEGPAGVQARADAGGRIAGTKHLVPFASSATRLLVLARTGEAAAEVDAFLVDPATASLEQLATMAADAQYRVVLDGAPGERVGEPGSGWRTWERAMTEMLIVLAAYACGAAQRAHEMAVAYAKERVQFGKPIGAFQAVAHPLAEAATEIEGAKVLAYEAAWAHARRLGAEPLAAMAKLYACDVFRRTTKLGQQVLGGIGFIRDVDMQLYFRRAKQMELLWWGPRTLEERIAAAELDGERPFVSVDGVAG